MHRYRDSIQQCSKNARSELFEDPPQLIFITPPLFGNFRQGDRQGSIQQVRPCSHVLDTIEDDWPDGVEEFFLRIGEEFACAEGSACGQGAQRIAKRRGQVRKVVKSDDPAVGRGDHKISFIFRRPTQRRDIGIEQGPHHAAQGRFGTALLAVHGHNRDRAIGAQGGQQKSHGQTPSVLIGKIDQTAKFDNTPAAAPGRGAATCRAGV